MLIVDSLIISGVKFVLTRLVEAVDAEMYDESALRDELLAAQMKLELGEITDEDFAQVEEQILAGLREIRARRKEAAGQAPEQGAAQTDGEEASGETGVQAPRFTIESIEANLDRNEEVED
ncbi:MAG TPA: gas vesicle protein GvpG [Labilithrix sp.]|nr:gas vesicle protein GvpG [Labilithrix sp.]